MDNHTSIKAVPMFTFKEMSVPMTDAYGTYLAACAEWRKTVTPAMTTKECRAIKDAVLKQFKADDWQPAPVLAPTEEE